MKVKRFIASDMRSAMQQVRESLGAEAVILSNRIIEDGVEILASNDYEHSAGNASQSEPKKRSYRTYADIPDEPFQQKFEDDKVQFSSQHNNTFADHRPKKQQHSQVQPGGIFDYRKETTESIENIKPSVAGSSASGQKPERKSLNNWQKIDYSKFIVEDEEAATKDSESAKLTPQQQLETESLKQELKALRSMMEAQMSLMSWEQQKKQNPVAIGLIKRFSELGLTVDIAKQVIDKVKNNTDVQQASKEAINQLIKAIPVATDDILKRQGIVALVGPTGVGKTTTIAKLAARYVMAHGQDQIALVTLDNYRIGAQEQLFNYARILRIPVHNAKDSNELHKILQNLYDKKLILIDTAGMSQKDMRICEQFNTLKQGAEGVRSYMVLAANAQTSSLDEIVRAFKQTDISGCIFTKLDETASLGGAISMLIRHQLPLAYISDGQAVPEDLQSAYGRDLVSRALDLLKDKPEQVNENDLALAFNEGMIHAH